MTNQVEQCKWETFCILSERKGWERYDQSGRTV